MAYANIISKHIAEIRAARREAAPIRATIQARKTVEQAPDFSALKALTVGDYQKWLRKQIREHGRRFEVGTVQHSPVDVFVKERTGLDFCLLAGGEIEVTVNGKTYEFFTDATDIAYYLYNDEHEFVVNAGEALKYAMWQDASTLIVG